MSPIGLQARYSYSEMTENKRNTTFTMLSVFGILFVMLGHLGWNVLDVGGIFPYYSFHVLLFVFISGYFYKTSDEENILEYIKHKAISLLLPYYIWNLFYGVLVTVLYHNGIDYAQGITFYSFFIEPFVNGHQYGLNSPAWFVPALFLLELINIIVRKMLCRIKLNNEYVIMGVYLLMGLITVYLAKRGSVYDYYKIPGRVLFMAPAFQFGRMYRYRIEGILKRIPGWIVAIAMLIINVILLKTQAGLNYSVVWVSSFANGIWVPFVSTITGILFWLSIAKIIVKYIDKSRMWKYISYMGSHTFDIMMHHLLGFFIINVCLVLFGVAGFENERFTYDVYYSWNPDNIEAFKILYIIAGVLLSLTFAKLKEKVCGLLTIGKTIRS